jgi:hypothetical protein
MGCKPFERGGKVSGLRECFGREAEDSGDDDDDDDDDDVSQKRRDRKVERLIRRGQHIDGSGTERSSAGQG